jgi:hypothetical protein
VPSLLGGDDDELMTEVEGSGGPVAGEVLDGEGEEGAIPAEKGASDLCALLARPVFNEREFELIAHACRDWQSFRFPCGPRGDEIQEWNGCRPIF